MFYKKVLAFIDLIFKETKDAKTFNFNFRFFIKTLSMTLPKEEAFDIKGICSR